jgi:hypothetical protein
MAFVSRQPCKEVKRAECKSTHCSILGFSRRSVRNVTAEWASGANVTEMFLDYVPEKMTKGCAPILRQRRLGLGVFLGKPIPRGRPLGGDSGGIGRFKGAGSLLGQARGRLSTTADLTSVEFEGIPAAGCVPDWLRRSQACRELWDRLADFLRMLRSLRCDIDSRHHACRAASSL